MNDKHPIKTSIDDVAREAKIAIEHVADKAKLATEKLAGATHEAVSTVREKVEAGGTSAAKKMKSAAVKIEDTTRDLGKKAAG